MCKVYNISKYREEKKKRVEVEKIQKRRDMVRSMDTLIEEAHKIGVCDECGGLGDRHITWCKQNPQFKENMRNFLTQEIK